MRYDVLAAMNFMTTDSCLLCNGVKSERWTLKIRRDLLPQYSK